MSSPKHPRNHGGAGFASLVVGAIGVVFGDIGTSPLYTLKQAFGPHYGLVANHDTVLGILSLVFWALTMVVTIKYVTVIMRADNEGEGGIMALMTLAQRTLKPGSRSVYLVGILGIFGASLFFGDGVITPAISVLSAVEGLEVVAPQLHHWIVPIVVLVLLVVFLSQRYGTEKVGRVFGPVMIAWFLALAVLGVVNILHAPEVLKAVNPWWAVRFFAEHHFGGVFILGAVVLAVTGGEALYTDMGHFGARPIRLGWYWFVLPALMLNYLGQGALVLEDPTAIVNPFYVGVPGWARWPMIVLATCATIIASQAVITGAFSISRQAMQLGYIPRMAVKHTSRDTIGQIYIPAVNWTLMVLVIGLVLSFQTSTALATAYGISVSATMLIDTLLLAIVARELWPRARNWVLGLCVLFLFADVGFLIAQKGMVPQAMLHNLKHNKVLHERNVFLTVETLGVPYAPKEGRIAIEEIGDAFFRVVLRFGFMETPDVPLALMRSCDKGGIHFDPMDTTYFASRETVVASRRRGMPIWRDKLFAVMHRNAAPATGFFRIPGNRLVELGAQVEI